MVCKILNDGKIIYLITQHVHTTFKISALFISQNIPVEMFFLL